MKAIAIDGYGGVDRLLLRELPEPRPQADELLVRVRAAAVNPVDWKICQGHLRFILRVNFPYIPGGDIAGEVVTAGAAAAPFKTGDAVAGHFAVQIAKALGAKVDATCGPSNIAFVQSLGAGRVIDYRETDVTALPDRYDVIFDAVGKSSFSVCRKLLARGGTYVTTLPGPGLFLWSGLQSIAGIFGNAKRAKGLLVRPRGRDVAFLGQLADAGKLRPMIGLTLPLEGAAEAHRASEAGHMRGKIVLEAA